MASNSQAPERADRGDATREALLATARLLFGERGYAHTSIDAIVVDAGVTKGAFYHHFRGKRDVFLRVYERVKAEIARAAFVAHVDYDAFATQPSEVRGPLKPFKAHDPIEIWQDLRLRCRRYVELHADTRLQRILLLDARAVLDWDTWRTVEREHGVVLLRADLRRAMRLGIVRPLPLNASAMILSGALHEACLLLAHADDRDEAFAEAFIVLDALLDGLRVRREELEPDDREPG